MWWLHRSFVKVSHRFDKSACTFHSEVGELITRIVAHFDIPPSSKCAFKEIGFTKYHFKKSSQISCNIRMLNCSSQISFHYSTSSVSHLGWGACFVMPISFASFSVDTTNLIHCALRCPGGQFVNANFTGFWWSTSNLTMWFTFTPFFFKMHSRASHPSHWTRYNIIHTIHKTHRHEYMGIE